MNPVKTFQIDMCLQKIVNRCKTFQITTLQLTEEARLNFVIHLPIVNNHNPTTRMPNSSSSPRTANARHKNRHMAISWEPSAGVKD